MQFVFQELVIIVEQYMGLSEEIVIERVQKAYYLGKS